MSHFVHKVIVEEPSLYSLSLPQIPNTKITNNTFSATFNTYGDFAQWLRTRAKQTLDWYTYGNSSNSFKNYWGDDTRCYTPEQDPSSSTRALIINQQAGFACALFYFGLTDSNTDYLHKAAKIAIAYKGTYTEKHPGLLWCLTPTTHTYPVLNLLSNNSYVWKHNGWREITCSDYINGGNDYEDISHGVQTLIYPRAINNRLESNNVTLFDDYDMIRFRNTFSFNVYAGTSSGCPQFHSGVDGDDVIHYDISYNGLNTLKIRSLAWMPFYKFDSYSSTPDVYDIVMNYYACDILNNITNVATGLDFYGLSEVVSAQWDKECVNLTLYNRNVTYDQDFIVKNKLVVAPQQSDNNYQAGVDDPFAEPKTFADNGSKDRFVVEPGTTVNFVAGKSITFGPGTHIKAGSNVRAYIDPTLSCPFDGKKLTADGGRPYTEQYAEALPTEEKIKSEISISQTAIFSVHPNPFSDSFTISFSQPDETDAKIYLTDAYGRQVLDIFSGSMDKGQHSIDVSTDGITKGLYFCIMETQSLRRVIKLVKH